MKELAKVKPGEREKFRLAWNDKRRSSMSDVSAVGVSLAEALSAKGEGEHDSRKS